MKVLSVSEISVTLRNNITLSRLKRNDVQYTAQKD